MKRYTAGAVADKYEYGTSDVMQPSPNGDFVLYAEASAPVTEAEWDEAVEANSDTDVTDYRGVCDYILAHRAGAAVPKEEGEL